MDLVLELPNILYILELKVNKPPEEGLDQIGMQKYYETFLHKNKPLRALGISFFRKKKTGVESSDFTIRYAVKNIRG